MAFRFDVSNPFGRGPTLQGEKTPPAIKLWFCNIRQNLVLLGTRSFCGHSFESLKVQCYTWLAFKSGPDLT